VPEVEVMFVSEIMSQCVMECTEDVGLEEVYDLIGRCEHGLVVVIDSHAHRVPIAIVSARSICEQIIGRERSPRNLVAGSVMDSRIKTVKKTCLVESIADIFNDDISALVVTDSDRRVCGLIPRSAMVSLREALNVSSPQIERSGASGQASAAEIPAFGWIQ
jgi:predicted transcriptional regulator